MLSKILSRDWWMTLLRGVVWILFGLTIFAMPGISLVTLTLLWGTFALADGLSTLVNALRGRRESKHWWLLLITGLAGILIGVLTFVSPALTALGLLYYIAIWAIAIGFVQVIAAIQLRKEITGELWLGLGGVASIAFGVLLALNPGAGVLTGLVADRLLCGGVRRDPRAAGLQGPRLRPTGGGRQEIWRCGRESNPRIAALQAAAFATSPPHPGTAY